MKWKHLKEEFYEDYMVSNTGLVRNPKGKIMKTNYDKFGYERLTINYKGHSKTLKVHQLVANAFLKKPKGAEVVNHKDGNKRNNDVSNLEWTTQSKNLSHAIRMGLKEIKGTHNPANKYPEEKIHEVCKLLLTRKYMNKEIAEIVFKDMISNDIERKRFIKLVSQIKTKARWSIVSNLYF